MNDSTTSAQTAGARSPLANGGAASGAQRFLALDGLRGVAAFAVILDHVPGGWLGDMLPGRYLAVDFFFVLSGFVLAHAYGERLAGGWSPLAFMKARLIRLWPMYLMGLALGLSLAVLGLLRGWAGPSWQDVLTAGALGLLFLPSPPLATFGGGALCPFNGPAWSLFFELVANMVYAAIARFLTWRVLLAILGVSAIAVAFTVSRHIGIGGPGWLWEHADAGLARVMFDFFAGVAIYRLRRTIRIPAWPWWIAVMAFIAVIAVPAHGYVRAQYDITASLLLMPLLVALSAGTQVKGMVARACAGLGLVSYGVYVIHVPLFAALGVAAASLHVTLPEGPLLALGVALLAALIVVIADRFYDRPLRTWLSGQAKRHKPRNVAGEGG